MQPFKTEQALYQNRTSTLLSKIHKLLIIKYLSYWHTNFNVISKRYLNFKQTFLNN